MTLSIYPKERLDMHDRFNIQGAALHVHGIIDGRARSTEVHEDGDQGELDFPRENSLGSSK